MGILNNVRVFIIGGDAREVEIARLLQNDQAKVTAFATHSEVTKIIDGPQCKTLEDGIKNADVILLPIPGMGLDESIYAPFSQEKVYIREEHLKVAKPNLLIIMGMASAKFKEIIKSKNFRLKEYEGDDQLMILRSRANAEGAVQIVMANTDFTIHKSNILLIGFGRTGQTLANLLIGMLANVLVAARNPIQRARAWEMGAEAVPLEEIIDHISNVDIVFNTVPLYLLSEEAFQKSKPHTLFIDISAPPGGINWELLNKVGRKGVWGRGLSGKRAPKTAGQSQYIGIRRILISEMGLKDS